MSRATVISVSSVWRLLSKSYAAEGFSIQFQWWYAMMEIHQEHFENYATEVLLLITLTYYRKEPAQLNLDIQSNLFQKSEEGISNQWNTSVQSIHEEVTNE